MQDAKVHKFMASLLSPQQRSLMLYIEQHFSSYATSTLSLHTHFTHYQGLEVAETLLALLQQHGLQPQLLGSHESYHAFSLKSAQATEQTLLLSLPYDHTAPSAQQLQVLATSLAALDACLHAYPIYNVLPAHLLLLIGSQGEEADLSLQHLFAQHAELAHATACIWDASNQTGILDDTIPHIALGCKGLLRVQLRTQTATRPVNKLYATIVPNALERLIAALQSIKSSREEVYIPHFYESIEQLPDAEIEPLYTLPDASNFLAQQWGVERPLLDLHGFQQHYVHWLTPTCTLTDIQGRPENSFPIHAQATLDFHLVPGQNPHTLFTALEQHLQQSGFSDTTIQMQAARLPVHLPHTHPFVQQVQQHGDTIYGGRLVTLPLIADSLPLAALGNIPCIVTAYGSSSLFIENIQHLALLLAHH